MQKKLASPILRAGFAAICILLIKKYFNYDMPTVFAEELVSLVLYAIIGISIVNNPNDSDKF